MKYSDFFVPTQKEKSSEAKIKSHILMIKSGMVRQETSGIYSWLPLGYRVLKKLSMLLKNFMKLQELTKFLCLLYKVQRFGGKVIGMTLMEKKC